MRAFDVLLRLYPASFRAEYGSEIRAIFEARRRAASGLAAVAGLWLGAVVDVAGTAARVHWDILRQDVRHAVRVLGRAPAFTATALLLAALGTGATTGAFSVADHVLIRPVGFPEAGRLVRLWQDQSFRGYPQMELSPGNYRDWRRMSTSFEAMAAYTERSSNLLGAGEPQRLEGALATGDLFEILQTKAVLGRAFTGRDAAADAPCTTVISDSLWRATFGADPAIVGRKVVLNGQPCTLIGVMPRGFDFPTRRTQFWQPLWFTPDAYEDRSNTFLRVVARLKPGVSIDEARSELQLIAGRLERAFPKDNLKTGASVRRLGDEVSWRTRTLILALSGASLCVLLIACMNLAGLLLARSCARQKELAVRAAIGGGRERLVRQMLTESVLLALAGGIAGVLLAYLGTPLASHMIPAALPVAEVPPIDLRVLVFAAILTTATGVGFGIVPALRATGGAESGLLRDGLRTGSTARTQRLRAGLVVAQVAATIVLLVAALLLIRALWRVQQIDPGFSSANVLTLRTSLPFPKYEATAVRERFYRRVLADVRALPGVSHAAYISFLPMVMRGGIWPVSAAGAVVTEEESRAASLRLTTPGFFDALRIPLRMGRDVSESDMQGTGFVAVVSRSFVRQHWPGQNPLGRRFKLGFMEPTVVGVVGDIKVRGLERESEPQVYVPSGQVPDGALVFYAPKDLVVRTEAPPGGLVAAIRSIISRADPEQPISDVQMLDEIVAGETLERAGQVRILGAFAFIALVLAVVGIHGLLTFNVSLRTREIGLRIALGATAQNIMRMILGRALLLGGLATVIGAVLAHAAARALEAVLAGVSPADATSFALAAGLALIVSAAGGLSPAWRAIRTDPTIAIRDE